EDIHELKDLKPGMTCPGIVTNVTNFGAFVDIGVHQDGLVHISRLSDRFVKDPRDVVSPGDRVTVRVIEVNLEKNQIALSMKTDGKTEGKTDAGARKQPGERPAQPDQERRQDRGQNRQQNRGPNQARDQKRRDDQKKPQKPAKVAFNNPFAQLANWGKDDE